MTEVIRGTAPTMLLIHGAWQGAWAFDAWRPLLAAAGWASVAIDLPGNGHGPLAGAPAGLDHYTACAAAAAAAIDGPLVVVGHSGGGLTATQLAEALPDRVAAVVHLAGMMLPSGCGYAAFAARIRPQPHGIVAHLQWNDDRSASRVPPEAALMEFLHDCGPAAARAAAARLTWQPESRRPVAPCWTAQRAGRVPRVYVECTQDRSLPVAVQQAMQAATPGARRVVLDCGHVPQLAQPVQLTRLLGAELALLGLAPSVSPRGND